MSTETTFRISEQDYVGAAKLFGRITPKAAAIYGAAVLTLGLAAIFGPGLVKGGAIGALIGGGIVAILGRFIINPFLARRHYWKYKAIHEPINIRLKEEGIELTTPDVGGLVRWETIFKWREDETFLLIYPMPRMYHIIPKSIGKSGFDVPDLIRTLQEKVGGAT